VIKNRLFTPPYEEWELEVIFYRWSLDPNDLIDRKIASILLDLCDRRGLGQALEAISRDDHEVHAEIVSAWREILVAS